MKIIVVGGGIGGLAAYHALKKHLGDSSLGQDLSVTIVESHLSAARTLGGGISLAPNGIRAISSIYPDAVPYIRERAFHVTAMMFRNSRGDLLGVRTGIQGGGERYEMNMVPRRVVHEALLRGIPQEDIRWGIKVAGVRESGAQIEVEYSDGKKDMVDLVIGADGVRSAVKNSLFGGRFEAVYDGLTGVGSFIDVDKLPIRMQESLKANGVTLTFGKQGFFGYSLCFPLPDPKKLSKTKPFIQWWSIYENPVIPERKDLDYDTLKKQLIERHGHWVFPSSGPDIYPAGGGDDGSVFRQVIELGCQPPKSKNAQDPSDIDVDNISQDTSVMVLPRYVTPPLPYWTNATSPDTPPKSKGRIVLMGDAAHTMPPDVGQGVSCAVEDAVVYALLLKHYLELEKEDDGGPHSSSSSPETPFSRAAKAYEEVRKPRVQEILDVAKYRGDAKKAKSPVAEKIRDWAIWVTCKLPGSQDLGFGYHAEAAVEEYLSEGKIRPKNRGRVLAYATASVGILSYLYWGLGGKR